MFGVFTMDEPKFYLFEDDESIRQIMMGYLNDAGFSPVETFEDSLEGWGAIAGKPIKAVIMDWKMPRLSGMALLNRLRSQEETFFVPILIVSGIIQQNEFKLLEEFPFIKTQAKPFSASQIKVKLEQLLEQSKASRKHYEKIQSIFARHPAKPKKIYEELFPVMQTASFSADIVIFVGKKLNSMGCHALCTQLLSTLYKKHPDSVGILTELGKAYLHQGNWKMAKKLLDKAQQNSPDNVERLLLLAKGHLNDLELDQAESYYKKAAVLDKNNSKIADGHSLVQEMQHFASADPSNVSKNFASLINALGISKVRAGEYDEGIDLYQKALGQVFSKTLKSKIAFNIALGHVKNTKKDEAATWLKKSLEFSPFEKAEKMLVRLGHKPPGREADLEPSKPIVIEEENPDVLPAKQEGEDFGFELESGFDEGESDFGFGGTDAGGDFGEFGGEDFEEEQVSVKNTPSNPGLGIDPRQGLQLQLETIIPAIKQFQEADWYQELDADDLAELLQMCHQFEPTRLIQAIEHVSAVGKVTLHKLRNTLFNQSA